MAVKQVSRRITSTQEERPLTLRLSRRHLLHFALVFPLLLALIGFTFLQARLPDWPIQPSEGTRRGSILAADGSVLAEGFADSRQYPQATLAAHLIGFSGAVQPDGRYGLEGIEYTLDTRLQAGEDVRLTINPTLQAAAQAELKKAVEAHQAESGAVMMIEVGTGRILAAASYPTFNPNTQASLQNRSAIINKAFMKEIEPGSTMKPFVVAALLESGKLSADEIIEADMSIRVGNQTFRDVARHDGTLRVEEILSYSSNVGMIHIGMRFTPEELYRWFERFGFNQRVNLSHMYSNDGEINHWQNWVPQDQATAIIGGGFTVTALQLATAYSVFANDGMYVTPRLVEDAPWQESYRVLSPEVAHTMREMLLYTVENSGLYRAKVPGIKVGGKSGTADVYNPNTGRYEPGDYTLHFAGMFPAKDPRVVMTVYLHKPEIGHSSTLVAAPLFSEIATEVAAAWGMPGVSSSSYVELP